jgi:hypothetical protein
MRPGAGAKRRAPTRGYFAETLGYTTVDLSIATTWRRLTSPRSSTTRAIGYGLTGRCTARRRDGRRVRAQLTFVRPPAEYATS